ncbi:hypothetical protein OIDMADRAFT_149160 [Oidiodendron maius Zn]|uniref:Uncharacterized protein n=1 Tax=Oidiodendron maius (strain Zn) TaxID=913774 RepID=A0A0C3C7X4_OIDMZ|nr:hypothetical protein OIDMADRAFT_149160 [Oidiodendron maius Zn]
MARPLIMRPSLRWLERIGRQQSRCSAARPRFQTPASLWTLSRSKPPNQLLSSRWPYTPSNNQVMLYSTPKPLEKAQRYVNLQVKLKMAIFYLSNCISKSLSNHT